MISTINYHSLKDGDRVEALTKLPSGYYEFMPGTVYINNDEPFFPKRVRLDYNSKSEPIIEHRMDNIQPISKKV